ncbi:MAG: hypothetical protein ACE5KX_04795 [Acidimicrobiia bacterium]
MRRKLSVASLAVFLILTGVYVFVYLVRSFQSEGSGGRELVGIWHGDNFTRAILVAIFFLIGEVFAIYLALSRQRRNRVVSVRADLGNWLSARSDLTGESIEHIAERALSLYRLRLEGGPQRVPSIPDWGEGAP